MQTLFEVDQHFPPGFTYSRDFITKAEEGQLLESIEQLELHNMNFRGYTATRRIASFGYDYSFESFKLSEGKPIPPQFIWLIDKVAAFSSIAIEDFIELLVTEYPEGAVINWHRDAPPFGVIAGISLLSDCTFKLRPHDKASQSRSSVISFTTHRRSLYIMDGEARSKWQHSISPVKNKRYSITLRTLKKK